MKDATTSEKHVAMLARTVSNEKGLALVLALFMLAIMSLIATVSLNISSTEVRISGNYKTGHDAMFGVDRALEYVMVNEDVFTTIGTGEVNVADVTEHLSNIIAGTDDDGDIETALVTQLDTTKTNKVQWIATGALPPGSGSDPTYFQARYYALDLAVVGANNATGSVEAQVVRVVPK